MQEIRNEDNSAERILLLNSVVRHKIKQKDIPIGCIFSLLKLQQDTWFLARIKNAFRPSH